MYDTYGILINVDYLNKDNVFPPPTVAIQKDWFWHTAIWAIWYSTIARQDTDNHPSGTNIVVCWAIVPLGSASRGRRHALMLQTDVQIWAGITMWTIVTSLFLDNFSIIKTLFTYWISHSYLSDVPAAELGWHLAVKQECDSRSLTGIF